MLKRDRFGRAGKTAVIETTFTWSNNTLGRTQQKREVCLFLDLLKN